MMYMLSQALMAKTYNGYIMSNRVTRDHHNLRRNLNLNGNYISNDGGNEGISMTDAGDMTLTLAGGDLTIKDAEGGNSIFAFNAATPEFKIIDDADNPNDFFSIAVGATGVTTIKTFDNFSHAADLEIEVDGELILNVDAYIAVENSGVLYGKIIPSTIDDGITILGETNKNMTFASAGSGNIVIDARNYGSILLDTGDTGNVGINNPVPGSILEISKVTGDATLELSSWSADNAHSGVLKFQKSGIATVNTFGDGAGTEAGEVLGSIQAWGTTQDSTAADDEARMSSYIAFANDAASREGGVPGKIIFATNPDSDNSVPAIRMTIDDGGNVGIGVSDPDSALEVLKTTTQLKLSFDTDSFATITVADDSDTTITTGESGDLTLDPVGALILEGGSSIQMGTNFVFSADTYAMMWGGSSQQVEITSGNLQFTTSGNIDCNATGEIDFNTSTAGFTAQAATGDGTTTIDWTNGNKFHLLFAASTNEEITFGTNPTNPCNLLLKLKQPSSGAGCTANWTMADATLYWVGGGTDETGEPTLSTGVNDVDIITFYFDGTNYYGVASLGFDA